VEKEDYEKYIKGFYDVNPEEIDVELARAVKAFFTFSVLTGDAYTDQLIAKDHIKKVSAQAFLAAKEDGATDNKAKEKIHVAPIVIEAKKEYFKKLREYEGFKAQKETTVMKKESLVSMSFNRKTDARIENFT
jgi:hypothetical protein